MVIKYGSAPKRFQSTWDTTQAGSANDTVVLPLQSDGSYNFRIDWGDGKANRDNITVYNQSEVTHQYDDTGIYTIKVVGGITGWRFLNAGDDDKILDVSQWGPLVIYGGAFYGCSNLNISATDIFELLYANSMENSFRQCDSLRDIPGLSKLDVSNLSTLRTTFYNSYVFGSAANLNNWNTSNITNMEYVFNATNFSGLVSGWDTSNVTSMRQLFQGCENFNDNIGNWDVSKVTSTASMFQSCDSFNQDLGNWDVSGVTTMYSMFYAATGFNNGGSSSISGWNTSNVTTMYRMFANAYPFNQPIGSWDTSNVTSMTEMFRGCQLFDQEIGNWDVGKVTNFRLFFYNSSNKFNNGGSDSISGWNTSSVVGNGFEYMFYGCTGFNQPIGSWDISGATSLYNMFYNCNSFNQPLSGWDTSSVTNMAGIFRSASNFNQDIGSWDTSSVSNMVEMFYSAVNFNNGGSSSISGWDTSNVTTMYRLFFNTAFNQPIGNWNTSKVTNMQDMFRCSFNQDISTWDVSNVNSMRLMFYSNSSFNQPIGAWNTNSLTNIQQMLSNADAFDQDLSNWVVTGITTATYFMNGSNGLSTTNYDRTLSGWSSQAVQNGVNIHFGSSKYSTATGLAYRNALVASGWTITDGGAV